MNKNWLSKLKNKWLIITYRDYNILKKKTNNFINFSKCNAHDFNLLRILHNISYTNLAKKTNFSYSWITKILRKEKQITFNVKQSLSDFFKDLPKPKIEKDEIIVKTEKHYKRISSRFKTISNIDNDIVKWFAILHSEGYSRNKGIVVVQKNYPKLLKEFIKISKEKFNIFGRVWTDKNKVKRYEFYSYPFIDYLRFKFELKLGASRKSTISKWVLNLPKDKQRLFLKYFFHGDGYFSKRGIISITQVNKNSIQILSKILKNLNINHRLYKQQRKKSDKIWIEYILTISTKDNLKKFLDQIGTFDKERFKRVNNYLKNN